MNAIDTKEHLDESCAQRSKDRRMIHTTIDTELLIWARCHAARNHLRLNDVLELGLAAIKDRNT